MSLPRPSYNTRPVENGVNIQIQARTIKEAKQQLQRAKKQIPQLDVEQLLSKAKEGEQLLPEHIEKLKGVIWKELEPFILHQITSNREFTNASYAPFDDTNDDKNTKLD